MPASHNLLKGKIVLTKQLESVKSATLVVVVRLQQDELCYGQVVQLFSCVLP